MWGSGFRQLLEHARHRVHPIRWTCQPQIGSLDTFETGNIQSLKIMNSPLSLANSNHGFRAPEVCLCCEVNI